MDNILTIIHAVRTDLSTVRVSEQDGARRLLHACDCLDRMEAALRRTATNADTESNKEVKPHG